jgi:hypothetical protein
MLINDVIASTYVLLNNAGEDELDYPIVMEQLASLVSFMKSERLLGNVTEVIVKGDAISFNDTTGVTNNTLENFGEAVYATFNGMAVDVAPVSQLDLYADMGIQRIAFWTDSSVSGTKKVQLALKVMGDLEVWYEPDDSQLLTPDSTVELRESLKYCLATRLAANCIQYVHFKDPIKQAGLPVLALTLSKQAEDWRRIYIERMNRFDTGRPFARLPFVAGSYE